MEHALDLPLTGAGYERRGRSWVWETPDVFVAVSGLIADVGDGDEFSFRVGWRYVAFGDPAPDPPLAHGCVRSLTFDEIARSPSPLGRVRHMSVSEFEQRLATIVRKHLVGFLEGWKRADGFRDWLAAQTLHLGAAWASAVLGHHERTLLELGYAAHLYGQPLHPAFDRARADLDEALAAVFAAPRGLTRAIEAGGEPASAAFSSPRGRTARDRVLDPTTEHRRLQDRHSVYADACIRFLGTTRGAR